MKFRLAVGLAVALGVTGEAKDAAPDRPLPAFAFPAVTASQRKTLGTKDLKGKPWIAQLMFTKCQGPCPMMTRRMAQLQTLLPKDAWLVSFTVDPVRDTLDVLQEHARAWKADPNRWWFVRAEKHKMVEWVQRGLLLSVIEDPKAPSGQRVTHSTKLVLVDAKGIVKGYYDGEQAASLTRLAADVNALARAPSR